MKSRARLPFLTSAALLPLLLLASSCGSRSAKSVGASESGSASESSASRGRVATRPELIEEYDKLAGEILETREREIEVVRSIVEATMEDARSAHARARRTLASGDTAQARPALEDLATLVGLLAMEGDASVARIRKRLVEGGHHYNPLHSHERDPSAAHGGPDGTHGGPGAAHHAGGTKEGHAAGDAPGHHAGKPGAAGEQKPGGHHAGATKDGHATGDAPGHHAGKQPGTAGEQKPGGHHAGEKGEGHHADAQRPGHAAPGDAQDKAGHHKDGEAHHADGSALHGFDPGFVVVNRKAKKVFLDSRRALSLLSTAPALEALELEWSRVEAAWADLEKSWK